MEWKDVLRQALDYALKTSFKRVLSGMIVLGTSLLGLSWVDLASLVIQVGGSPGGATTLATVAQLTGIAMITVGFLGHWILYLREQRSEREAALRREERAAAELIGRIKVLLRGFPDAGTKRDSGYYNQELIDCQKAALAFQKVAPPALSASTALSAMVTPKVDASKKKPYHDLELHDLEAFVDRLEKHYATGR